MENRPRGREKNVTGAGKPLQTHGSGLGTGPVGRPGGYSSRPSGSASSGGSSSNQRRPFMPRTGGTTRAGGRHGGLLPIIIAGILLLGGGGGLLGSLGGNSGGDSGSSYPSSDYSEPSGGSGYSGSSGAHSGGSGSDPGYSGGLSSINVSSLFNSLGAGTTSSGWSHTSNTGKLDTTVAPEARAKRTKIAGNGKDTVTIMVYMCGTDLESKSGMGSADLSEMAKATLADNVNIIVYTGGCKGWRTQGISASTNQIYQVVSGGLKRLDDDMGALAMTKPETLTEFIRWCGTNYPANRNELIFWDHGGGSLTGYGYDEKYPNSGSMTLNGIHKALKDSKMTFDFIGFDACLMATAENALMLAPYADYLIASEETEPGIGWYYTNWLTKLSANTSMPTIEIGKNIVDDFVDTCARQCSGQGATLSVIDLAELEKTAPKALTAFSASTSDLLSANGYQTVSNARVNAREFAGSNKLDQIDLIDMAYNMGTAEGDALAEALLGAVKYNRSSLTDAYGLSIYFPYKKLSSVSTAVAAYDAIDMDDEYTACIKKFASLTSSGQYVSGGASSPVGSLSGSGYSSAGTSYSGYSDIFSALTSMMGGRLNGVSGLNEANSDFLDKSLDLESLATFLTDNRFDPNALVWQTSTDGTPVISLSEKQWSLVTELELNVFADDGSGYIDLGLDNVFDFTENGDLIGAYDATWLAINDQPVAYYYESTFDDGENYTITGRVPVLLNGDLANLILVFDNAHPYGYIAGARYDYDGETDTVAKSLTELTVGDTLDFVCDRYGYDGSYQDSYLLGDTMTVTDSMVISNVYLDAQGFSATYLFTDIYQQEYWTPVIP